MQTTLAVPAGQIKECRFFFFRTSVLTSFFWKPEAPSIFLSSHRAQLTTTRTNLGVLFYSILLFQHLVSRMTLFLHADVLFPQMSIILSHKPRPPLTEMSNTWPCLWQPGRRAELLLAGGTSGTPTGPKTLRTRCRWSVGEETSRSIQVKVMYFVVVVIFFFLKTKKQRHAALCCGSSEASIRRWRCRCQRSRSRTDFAAAAAVLLLLLLLLLVVLSRVWTLAEQSEGATGFVFIAQDRH